MRTARPVRRPASLSIELLLLLPVLFLVVVAAVQFSLLIAAEQKLEAASAIGARVAAQGGDGEAIANAVQDFLGGGRWKDAEVKAKLTDANDLPIPSGGNVEVIVSIQAGKVVSIALGFRETNLSGRTLMRKE